MFSKDLLSRGGGRGVGMKGPSNFCREGEEEKDPLEEKLKARPNGYDS